MHCSRIRSLALGALTVLACFLPVSVEAQAAAAEDMELKAAYALKFLHYTQWPDEGPDGGPEEDPAKEHPDARIILVVGDRAQRTAILRIAREAERLGQPRVRVRWADPRSVKQEDLIRLARKSHAVYIASSSLEDATSVLTALAEAPVLTIGDAPGFVAAGGMLALARQGTRLAFDANNVSIRAAGLQVSARVLSLARSIRDKE